MPAEAQLLIPAVAQQPFLILNLDLILTLPILSSLAELNLTDGKMPALLQKNTPPTSQPSQKWTGPEFPSVSSADLFNPGKHQGSGLPAAFFYPSMSYKIYHLPCVQRYDKGWAEENQFWEAFTEQHCLLISSGSARIPLLLPPFQPDKGSGLLLGTRFSSSEGRREKTVGATTSTSTGTHAASAGAEAASHLPAMERKDSVSTRKHPGQSRVTARASDTTQMQKAQAFCELLSKSEMASVLTES
ncbi:hypothetical protein MG293_012481 [Ovis ammon polii]|uniref:Uncharacterized protein n=1 Tax=Ovis ammon polii TaxID=230172 RepID=A0AAD4TZR5_OVIAM|nr:hypothetical protein MG293_012481 [Ovis ammon polii]